MGIKCSSSHSFRGFVYAHIVFYGIYPSIYHPLYIDDLQVLDLLARYLELRCHDKDGGLGGYRVLTGRVAAEDRDTAIREFNNDPKQEIFVFLLSTRAGGLGINLVSAGQQTSPP